MNKLNVSVKTEHLRFMVPGATERVSVIGFEELNHLACAWSESGFTVDISFFEALADSTAVSVK